MPHVLARPASAPTPMVTEPHITSTPLCPVFQANFDVRLQPLTGLGAAPEDGAHGPAPQGGRQGHACEAPPFQLGLVVFIPHASFHYQLFNGTPLRHGRATHAHSNFRKLLFSCYDQAAGCPFKYHFHPGG